MDQRKRLRLQSDVLVVVGGAAGVATAVTAARQGPRVTLVERYGFCGGGAVAGLSGTVCGLYAATDQRQAPPEQVVFGFADEFCNRLNAMGGLSAPMRYGKTWTRVHDPLIWRETADSFLREASVEVIFHAVAIGLIWTAIAWRGSISGRRKVRSTHVLRSWLTRAAMPTSLPWRVCPPSSATMAPYRPDDDFPSSRRRR